MSNKYEEKIEEKGELPVKVSREVVGHLSHGLYRDFARAVKELVSNAYDADATEVKIKIDLENRRIIVRDNGRGMNKEDIEDKYLSIGFITPPTERKTPLGRMRVGTFGIGCLAVFPYCSTMRVISKAVGSDRIVEIEIQTSDFFKARGKTLSTAKVPYKLYKSDIAKDQGETIIVLDDVQSQVIEDIQRECVAKDGSSIEKFSGRERFKWVLSQYLPIPFKPEQKVLAKFFSDHNKTPMRVWIDGEELHRNVPEGVHLLEKGEENFGKVKVKYVIMTTMEPIRPKEARGLQVRLRDVAISTPRDFDVIKLTGKMPGKLNYLCGEVHVVQGLNNALMIDRDTFSYTKVVAEIDEFFRKKLVKWNNRLEAWSVTDKDIYEALSKIDVPEAVEDSLRKAGVLHFSKKRLRMKTSSILRRGGLRTTEPLKQLSQALEKVGNYEVVTNRKEVSAKISPVQVNKKKKSIVIHEKHPQFKEKLEIAGTTYEVEYANWPPKKSGYSICRIKGRRTAIFNLSHPLFKTSRLGEEALKKLALGIVTYLEKAGCGEKTIRQLNDLLEDIFIR